LKLEKKTHTETKVSYLILGLSSPSSSPLASFLAYKTTYIIQTKPNANLEYKNIPSTNTPKPLQIII
jgi:hypothetical protein